MGFRLLSMISNKRFYFSSKGKIGSQKSHVDLMAGDIDKENNCVTLRVKACGWWTRVCDRRIFYLEQDGPEFMKFLIEQKIIKTYNVQTVANLMKGNFNVPTNLFTRQTVPSKDEHHKGLNVTGYTVTLTKADGKNSIVTGIMSSWALNWMGQGKMMEQTCQLRVYTDEYNNLKYFEISQLMGNQKFKIIKITSYDEEQNRVRLTAGLTDGRMAAIAQGGPYGGTGTVDRYLYFDTLSDSKKFLLFLMEMYHKDYNTSGKTTVFSKATELSIPTFFQEPKQYKFVKEYIGVNGDRFGLKGLVNPKNTGKFEALWRTPKLTPENVRTKSSIIETLFKEIQTLKREKQNKRGVALRQLSESRLIRSNTPRMTSVSKSSPTTPRAQEYPTGKIQG